MKVAIIRSEPKKRALIERLSREGIELAVYFEEDPGDTFAFRRLRDGIIAIAPPYDYDALETWWYLGNWQAVAPVVANFQPFDTFRSTDAQIEQRFKTNDVSILIDSFHDNTDWKVIER